MRLKCSNSCGFFSLWAFSYSLKLVQLSCACPVARLIAPGILFLSCCAQPGSFRKPFLFWFSHGSQIGMKIKGQLILKLEKLPESFPGTSNHHPEHLPGLGRILLPGENSLQIYAACISVTTLLPSSLKILLLSQT